MKKYERKFEEEKIVEKYTVSIKDMLKKYPQAFIDDINERKLWFARKYKNNHNKQIESFIKSMHYDEKWPKEEIIDAVSYLYSVTRDYAISTVRSII